jgi:hypothetical protein
MSLLFFKIKDDSEEYQLHFERLLAQFEVHLEDLVGQKIIGSFKKTKNEFNKNITFDIFIETLGRSALVTFVTKRKNIDKLEELLQGEAQAEIRKVAFQITSETTLEWIIQKLSAYFERIKKGVETERRGYTAIKKLEGKEIEDDIIAKVLFVGGTSRSGDRGGIDLTSIVQDKQGKSHTVTVDFKSSLYYLKLFIEKSEGKNDARPGYDIKPEHSEKDIQDIFILIAKGIVLGEVRHY